MEQTKDRKEWLGFIIGILLFVLLSILDSEEVCDNITYGLSNMWNPAWNKWRLFFLVVDSLLNLTLISRGTIFAIFPILSIVFIKMNKRIPSIIFAALNLIFSCILCTIVMMYVWIYGLGWILYVVSAVIILLYSLHPVPYRQSYYRISVLLAILSIILSLFYEIYYFFVFYYRGYWVPYTSSIRLPYGFIDVYGGMCIWPLSRGILLLTISLGLRKEKEKPNVPSIPNGNLPISNKSKVVAALLAFFLGTTGAHRYYLGYKKQAVVQTCGFLSNILGLVFLYIFAFVAAYGYSLLCPLSIAIIFFFYGIGVGIWAFVDFICILTGKLIPIDGSYRLIRVQVIQQAPSEGNNLTETLEKLAKLHEQGVLTDEEFQQKKAELLSKM